MQIQLENPEGNTIEAYSENQIKINGQIYTASLMVSTKHIDSQINVNTIDQLNLERMKEHLETIQPDIVIIGHQEPGKLVDMALLTQLAGQGIGLESMTIDAACRTFNILVSENRKVITYLLF